MSHKTVKSCSMARKLAVGTRDTTKKELHYGNHEDRFSFHTSSIGMKLP